MWTRKVEYKHPSIWAKVQAITQCDDPDEMDNVWNDGTGILLKDEYSNFVSYNEERYISAGIW
jgi:hypothetical protein